MVTVTPTPDYTQERAPPPISGISQISKRIGAFQMQSSNSIQIQDVQYQSEQGFCAVVYEPTAYLADIDVHSCTARRLGIYPSHAAAVAACQSFIASLSDDLKAWAAFSVTTAEQIR
nr:MAG TPA: hypothetical protein [Caudoviricetes sp.]